MYVQDKSLIIFIKLGKKLNKVRIPNPIGQIISCFDKIIPNTNGKDFLNPNCEPALSKIILAGPGVATMDIENKNKLNV